MKPKKISVIAVSALLQESVDQMGAVVNYLEAVRDDKSKRKDAAWRQIISACAAYTRNCAAKSRMAADDLLS